jgi:hypothetical protein
LEGYFGQINASDATLPQDLVQTTVDQVSLIGILDKLDLKFTIVLVQSLCEERAGIDYSRVSFTVIYGFENEYISV